MCVCADVIGRSRVLAAGATWLLVIASAPWAARAEHTSMIDAVSGAIYVIGGGNGSTNFNDVWASTNRGADRTRPYARGHIRVLVRYSRGK